MRRRSSVVWLVLLVLLATGFAWLTRHPDAKVLEKAQDWAVVGPLARVLRQAYLPSQLIPSDSSPVMDGDAGVAWVQLETEEFEAVPYVWVQPGSTLYERPDRQSQVLKQVTAIGNLSVLEQIGDWYRVRVPRPGDRPLQAWVFLEDYRDPSAEVLSQPDPVLPLPSRAPHPERISAARQLMQAPGVQVDCGPYRVLTDAQDGALLELCPRITRDLEDLYRQRYGLEPVSPPAEAIFLFREASDYRAFRDREQVPFESNLAHASPADGYVALFQGDRSTGELLGTLVHELTHLLNRRALGPALPPWLSEGIADDLAESRIGEDGSLQPGKLGGESRIEGRRVTRRGAVASAIGIQDALETGDLPSLQTLIEMDRQQFHDPDRVQIHYALSSFWVRYMLSGFDPGLPAGFQGFLQDVGSGEPITGDLLLKNLDMDWQGLESGFFAWMHLQFLTPPNETRDESS